MIDNLRALETIRRLRDERDVVVTTMGASRDWMRGGMGPLDLVFVPSAMGHATSIGLGLALAQPLREIFVCNGDGSMLMNLGSLVSIAAAGATNLTVFIFDNGVYEVTGAQPTPRGTAGVDFEAIARGAGIATVSRFRTNDALDAHLVDVLRAPGPRVVVLDVAPTPGIPGPKSPGKASVRAAEFMAALKDARA